MTNSPIQEVISFIETFGSLAGLEQTKVQIIQDQRNIGISIVAKQSNEFLSLQDNITLSAFDTEPEIEALIKQAGCKMIGKLAIHGITKH